MTSMQPTTTAADATPSSTTSSVWDAVTAGNRRFMTAFAEGNAAAVAACYTPDAQLLPANSDVVTGTDAIARFWGSVMAMGVTSARLETTEVDALGDVAVEVGRYALGGADGGTLDHGKYVVVWHRDGASWKIHRDIWTTSRPPVVA